MTGFSTESLERKLITVASGKGGVGKTWLAATLAHMLAREGRRVLLFDGDLGLANIDIQLGLTPARDLGDVIAQTCTLEEAALTYEEENFGKGRFDILAGKSGSGLLTGLSRESLAQIRADLIAAAADYDHIVLDLAAGLDMSVSVLSRHRGAILVVLTPDPTSLTDAYAFIKLTVQRMPQADVRIVVNMASSRHEGERTYEALRKVCQTFLKTDPPLAAIIRQDKKVTDAIRHQAPLLARHPQAEAAEGVAGLVRAVVKQSVPTG